MNKLTELRDEFNNILEQTAELSSKIAQADWAGEIKASENYQTILDTFIEQGSIIWNMIVALGG